MAPEIEWVSEEGRFSALAGEWDALAGGSPFDLHCWFSAWWRAFGEGAEMAVCTLRRDGQLAGVLPLYRHGGRLCAMANGHSPSFRPLARDADALGELVSAAAGAAAEIDLCCLPTGEPGTEEILERARRERLLAFLEPAYSSPTVDTSGSFDSWREQSKKRWGAPIERFRRKMDRDHEAQLVIMERPLDLPAELADGFAVEASGWKGTQGTAIVSQPETELFYTQLAEAFAARGELYLSRIVLDGETAAFDFTLLHESRLYLLKTGFDERFRKLAPGLVMRLTVIERCFELGLASHELLGEESEWKSKFATGSRPHATLRAHRRRPAGFVRHAYRAAVRPRLKRLYRLVRR